MSTTPDGELSEHLTLLRRLKGAYLSATLTILSIIQGVALAALAATVVADYARFTPAQWVMALVSFVVLIVAWNQIAIDTMTWVQVPDFQGGLIPFVVGGLELLLVAAITIGQALWLLVVAALAASSSVGLAYVSRQAGRELENARLLTRVGRLRGSTHAYNVAGVALCVLLAAGSLLGGFKGVDAAVGALGAAALLAALLPGLWTTGWLLRSFAYWRKVVEYARTGR